MKKQSILKWSCAIVVAICGISFTSCENSNGELTQSDVKSEVNRVLFSKLDYYTTGTIQLGYYEENSESTRKNLRELAAAGMVTYKAECIIENKKTYWGGKRKVEHVFVEVALTEKGQKYVVTDEEIEKIQEEIEKKSADKDLVSPNRYTEYPEDAVSDAEDMPVIDDEPVTEEPTTTNNVTTTTSSQSTTSTTPAADTTTTSYEKALAKVSSHYVTVELYKLDIYKVRNILCTTSMMEKGTAKAEVILEYVDVTPFGRILRGYRDGDKDADTVDFVKYTDSWKIKD